MSTSLHPTKGEEADLTRPLHVPIKRRSFFMYAGATAGAALLLASCDDDDDSPGTSGMVDVGSGDFGVLNYAYALEQLEAAFYAAVRAGQYYAGLGAASAEKQIFDDLALHEQIHADFFKAAIPANGGTLIKALETDFSTIDFNSRAAVLGAARDFEDLGVAAYNGAGRYLQSAAFLGLAGKIVSVEARHAGLIRDLISYNTFVGSDVVDLFTPTSATSAPGEGNGSGLEKHKTPTEVVATANKFLKEGSKLNVSNIQ